MNTASFTSARTVRQSSKTLRSSACILAAVLSVAAASSSAFGAVVYDESVSGNISGNRFFTTNLGTFSLGSNVLIGTSGNSDRDYFTITIAPNQSLSAIILTRYVSTDPTAFLGVQAGTTFTEPSSGTNVANLLGWTHFGSGNAAAGTDILDNLGAGPGAIGFTGGLGSGTYTFWLQQIGAPTEFTLDFVVSVIPAPSAAGCLCFAALAATRRRR